MSPWWTCTKNTMESPGISENTSSNYCTILGLWFYLFGGCYLYTVCNQQFKHCLSCTCYHLFSLLLLPVSLYMFVALSRWEFYSLSLCLPIALTMRVTLLLSTDATIIHIKRYHQHSIQSLLLSFLMVLYCCYFAITTIITISIIIYNHEYQL